MGIVIIAFPASKAKTAGKIKEILNSYGFQDTINVTNGNEALQYMGELDAGILICQVKLSDMYYTEMLAFMPQNFEMLLLDSDVNIYASREENVVSVSMPVKVREFIETVHMMMNAIDDKTRRMKKGKKRKKVRSEREENYINNAKLVLMERNHMTEEEAYRYIQKTSMDSGRSMVESAKMILTIAIM